MWKSKVGARRERTGYCKIHMGKSFEPVGFLNMTLKSSPACATSKVYSCRHVALGTGRGLVGVWCDGNDEVRGGRRER